MTRFTAGLITIVLLFAFTAGIVPVGILGFDIYSANAEPQDGGKGHEGGKRHGPPPEAVEACDGINPGEVCSFDSPRGDLIVGMCGTTRSGEVACIPEGGPPGAPPPGEWSGLYIN